MTTEISSDPASTAGASTENASSNVETPASGESDAVNTTGVEGSSLPNATAAATGSPQGSAPVIAADGKTYVPNFKYKAALQEKELDPFYHSLVKDADSEKRVKDLFTKVDAFDFVKGKKEEVESKFHSLLGDYDHMSNTVTQFNEGVKRGDLSSAFRIAGITKEQVFNWTRQQLQLMDMPPEQRAQHEQFERSQTENYDLQTKVQNLEQQYQHQAVQARAMQLDVALSRPEVAKFAESWDRNAEPGSFRHFVIEEAKKSFYVDKQDLSPEQAIAMVMQRFGKFLNTGDAVPQVAGQATLQNGVPQSAKPVIPNITGKAASPIKKVPRNLDDLKKLAREARD